MTREDILNMINLWYADRHNKGQFKDIIRVSEHAKVRLFKIDQYPDDLSTSGSLYRMVKCTEVDIASVESLWCNGSYFIHDPNEDWSWIGIDNPYPDDDILSNVCWTGFYYKEIDRIGRMISEQMYIVQLDTEPNYMFSFYDKNPFHEY